MKDTLINLVQKLLKKNKISFDKEELAFQIQSHPSYPSLHAITGVLDHFNIENVAADVPVNSETLSQLPDCFIAQINTDYGQDLVVIEKNDIEYIIHNSENKKEKISEDDFLSKFTGIIVAVEETENYQAPKDNTKLAKAVGFSLIIGLALFHVFNNTSSWYSTFFFLLSIVGVFISVAIVKQELGLKTSIGDAFCSGTDDKKDCDAVLTSKGAEVFKGYKLSDFCILYFSGLSLLTFIQISNPVISYTISLLAVPITLYSLYYQYAVVKKWCLLCLSIVGVLWLQALIPVLSNSYIEEFVVADFITFGLVATLTWITWNYIKPLFTEVNELKKEKIESVKFKRNYALFDNLLQKSPQIDTQLDNSQEIVFGNPNANLELTIITNPFCGHCKPVHAHVDEIFKRYQDKVKIKIRFNINTEDKENDIVKITSRLIEIYNTKGEKECLTAMDAIYEGQKPADWLKEWGTCENKEPYIAVLEEEKKWCTENAINFTPEILINGRSFPKEYKRTDLILFIEDLEENSQVLMSSM
ncbi:vitamin K epoxide reductase family protein [Tenacibaculum tangerinum]|uniref:Vitamin K epoxide reductase family protein n=1 Tax=Tenacibaculum tangerinum TaxID=3038772 RepID=A0ABY8L9D7_9FLAO|nr:vitamin K epoxide reductase family protein [Tenacibaculum tangerinum]WGH76845.1 vitamin K epoxide reductase family protein [Tenacibaculum tangerinum]